MPEKKINYYEVLGVERSATKNEIAQAYRKKARDHHPDKNLSSNGDMFKLVLEAYETLTDDDKKAEHDEMLSKQEAQAKKPKENKENLKPEEIIKQNWQEAQLKTEKGIIPVIRFSIKDFADTSIKLLKSFLNVKNIINIQERSSSSLNSQVIEIFGEDVEKFKDLQSSLKNPQKFEAQDKNQSPKNESSYKKESKPVEKNYSKMIQDCINHNKNSNMGKNVKFDSLNIMEQLANIVEVLELNKTINEKHNKRMALSREEMKFMTAILELPKSEIEKFNKIESEYRKLGNFNSIPNNKAKSPEQNR